MKKICNALLLAVSMFVVSCAYEDPFLGNNIECSEKENRKNIDAFINTLTDGCLLQWNAYVKEPDGKWEFEDYGGVTGVPSVSYIMLDEHTLLGMCQNIRGADDDTPVYPYAFVKYDISYNYSSGVIITTSICEDGSFGETYSCNLYRSKDGIFVCDGQLGSNERYASTPTGMVKLYVRWCFEARDYRSEIVERYEQYEQWLSENR